MISSTHVKTLLASLLAPDQNACRLCRTRLFGRESYLCADCWQELAACRIEGPEAAFGGNPPLASAHAAYWHDGAARSLLHRLKFGYDPGAAEPLAEGMAALYAGCLERLPRPDAVVAVPAHLSRLRARGYNQADVLARAFCERACLPYLADGLCRVHHLSSQVSRSRQERLTAMAGAFEARADNTGMHILLVDDVLTTGATAMACGECLMAAGAVRVDLLAATKA